jgi:hypothetical protein
MIADYGPAGCKWGYNVIHQWTEEHSQDKVRFDFLQAWKSPSTNNEWEIFQLAGKDMVFAAFKNERDYLHFMLRWA